MTDPAAYAASHPDCDIDLADTNHDGSHDGRDIALFVDALLAG